MFCTTKVRCFVVENLLQVSLPSCVEPHPGESGWFCMGSWSWAACLATDCEAVPFPSVLRGQPASPSGFRPTGDAGPWAFPLPLWASVSRLKDRDAPHTFSEEGHEEQ